MAHPKAALVERAQAEGRGKPQFATERSGPDHEPVFTSHVSLSGAVYGRGAAGNKRDAERRAAEAALRALDDAALQASSVSDAEPFEGPWPVFESVLATSLQVAHARVSPDLRGDAALEAIHAFALRLYKGVLEDLGDVVEEDEEGPAD
jgi:ribonuclease III